MPKDNKFASKMEKKTAVAGSKAKDPKSLGYEAVNKKKQEQAKANPFAKKK